MPIDPGSIITYVTTAIGVVTFVADTVGKLAEKKRDYQGYMDRMSWYRSRMETVMLELSSWTDSWCNNHGQPFPESTYIDALSESGYEGVQRRLRDLQKETNILDKILTLDREQTVSPSDRDLWLETLRSASRDRNFKSRSPRILEKLMFAIIENAELKDRIETLEDMVEDLEKWSRTSYIRHNEKDADERIQLKDVQKLHRVREGIATIVSSLSLEPETRSVGERWSLVLGRPALEHGLECLEEDEDMTFEFVVERPVLTSVPKIWRRLNGPRTLRRMTAKETTKSRRSTLTFTMDDHSAWAVRIARIDLGTKSGLSTLRTEPTHDSPLPLWSSKEVSPVKDILKQCQDGDLQLRKASELMRAKVAVHLVNSIVLLHRSSWVGVLCTCEVRYTDLEDQQKIVTFHTPKVVPSDQQPEMHCHNQTLSSRGFLLLAVALAELAIASPVVFQTGFEDSREPKSLRFQVGKGQTISVDGLLKLVGRKSSLKYKRAVQFSFDLDQRLQEDALAPKDIKNCLVHLIKP